ncbi:MULTISPECIES: ribonuclease Z [Exiguobacterium]|uniref:Ribonuclease Z n=1 Tax=Exiguobacterium antarcticum TaxID=132920 RepID=A0ABT6R334_9BACL|nr:MULTISPECIES: ribonuclease Z [Exiguobacterium]MCT4779466.1 ribonuclease Z [Exiguobacterium soli]MDI3235357.1 ribonuclease Z [Exiguobacterium antarcticum]
MEFYFLGTGAGMPSKQRNVSSIALLHPKMTWLFDCGEATQHQMLHSPIKPRKVSTIFITHLHGDHIFGLPGFISTRAALEGTTRLTIYGPKGLREWLEATLRVTGTYLRYPLDIIEVEAGQTYQQEGFRVTVEALEHRFLAYGYRIEGEEEKGALLVEALQELGIPSGPLYRRIKQDSMFVFDGVEYQSADFLGTPKPGVKLAILGDTIPCAGSIRLAQEVDVLVHEATFADSEEDHAGRFGHSTARQAAEIARQAQAKKLLLTHISARYVDQEQRLEAEAREVFQESYLMMDHQSVVIKG